MLNLKLEIPESLKRKLDPSRFQKAVQDGTLVVAKELQGEARPYPGPVVHPIEWASDKQRKWYFASRREKGLPIGYTRGTGESNDMKEVWSIEPYKNGAMLFNKAPYAPYVIGEKQQPFHRNTGWKKLFDVAQAFFDSGKAQKAFNAVIRKFFG